MTLCMRLNNLRKPSSNLRKSPPYAIALHEMHWHPSSVPDQLGVASVFLISIASIFAARRGALINVVLFSGMGC